MRALFLLLLLPYMPVVEYYAEMHDVDPAVIWAIGEIESNWRFDVTGYSGEKGFLQIMPPTAEYIANCTGMTAEQILNDPEMNIKAGTWLFSLWYHRFLREGRENPLDLALSSYNGGAKYIIDHNAVNPITQYYVDKVKGVLGIEEKVESVICIDHEQKCLREKVNEE